MKNNSICNTCGQYSAEYENGSIICYNEFCTDFEKQL